ncbi:hypothetical protein [uncultured Croceitalea sp.]|uniref:hypothetical protein n=1 Tax=uncultured Croceitalea sp. TaxID=1798908 RepID=UPI0033067785
MRLWFCILLQFLFVQSLLSQNELASVKDFLDKKFGYVDEVIPIKNKNTGELAVFFTEGKTTHAFLFDNSFKKIDSLSGEDKRRKYKQVIGGGTGADRNYIIYFSNPSRTKFASIDFSFKTKEARFHEFDFELDNERLLQTVHIDDSFYILTIEKKSSVLHTYKFKEHNAPINSMIDLSAESFLDDEDEETTLYDLLTTSSGIYNLGKSVNIVKINIENPTTLEIAAQPTKFYETENGFLISFDQNKQFTQLVELDLINSTYNMNRLQKPLAIVSPDKKRTNSFVHDKTVYTIAVVENLIYLQCLNLETGELINEHSVDPQGQITLKNTPVVQTGGDFSSTRELKKVSKVFRKINLGEVGISVFKAHDIFEVAYGGIHETKSNPAMFFPGFAIPIAASGGLALSLFINPAFFAFESYSNTKAVKIEAIFDATFEHLNGDIPLNAFDKIKNFAAKEKVLRNGRTVFRFNGNYIFGYYDSWTKTFSFREFKNN